MPKFASCPRDALAMQSHMAHHLHRLHSTTSSDRIRPKVDTSPPLSMYNSPKSIHYRPFPVQLHRRPHSADYALRRNKLKESRPGIASSTFLKRFPSQSSLTSHNIYAASSSAQSNVSLVNSRPSTALGLRLSSIGSKLRESKCYQPADKSQYGQYKKHKKSEQRPLNLPPAGSHSIDSQALLKKETIHSSPPNRCSSSTNFQPSPKRLNSFYIPRPRTELEKRRVEEISLKYDIFKEQVLNNIILRGVYNDRVIEDCFLKQMEKFPDLSLQRMHQIMDDMFMELGIKRADSVKYIFQDDNKEIVKRVVRIAEKPPISKRQEQTKKMTRTSGSSQTSLSSTKSTSSSGVSSSSKTGSEMEVLVYSDNGKESSSPSEDNSSRSSKHSRNQSGTSSAASEGSVSEQNDSKLSNLSKNSEEGEETIKDKQIKKKPLLKMPSQKSTSSSQLDFCLDAPPPTHLLSSSSSSLLG